MFRVIRKDPLVDPTRYHGYNLCPCQSGEKAKFCCKRDGKTWNVQEKNIQPQGLLTNYRHRLCYAVEDSNCSENISREHYIPESVLRLVGETVNMSGLKFIDGSKDFRAEVLKSKILCERHNNAFSKLDDVARRFFATIERFINELARDHLNAKNEFVLFNGDDIERILLKALIGLISAQVLTLEYVGLDLQKHEWTEIMYSRKLWPKGWGLYVKMNGSNITSPLAPSLNCGFGVGDRKNLTRFGLQFYEWHLMVRLADNLTMNNNDEASRYRPELLVFERGTTAKVIRLTWREAGDRGFVRMKIHGTTGL